MSLVPNVEFVKLTAINEVLNIHKDITAHVSVSGNSAVSNATADAMGHNTVTETLTQTNVAQGIGSSSVSESVSATSGSYWHW
jgi:hypothetical protein